MKKLCLSVLFKRFLSFCILGLLFINLPGVSFSQVQTLTPVQVNLTNNIGGMYVSLPVDYNSNPGKKYPLLVFMHGIGERGNGTTDITKLAITGLPKYIKNGLFPSSFNVGGENFSFIVVCPQVKLATDLANNTKATIDYALANYRVDEQRVYLTGLSMGGMSSSLYALWAKTYSEKLAALLVICPGVDSSYYGNNPAGRQRIKNAVDANLPVWITTNSNDNVVTTWKQIAFADSLNRHKISPPTKLTVFQANGHDAWTKTYNPAYKEDGMNVYEWMLTHKRGGVVTPLPPVANAGTGQSITLPVNSVILDGSKSTAPSGSIKSYLWTKLSGPASGVISSPSAVSTNVTNLAAGTYEFQLLVTDNNNKTSTAKVTITVKPALLPPTANAGNAQTITLPANSVTINGSASTAPSGTIVSYQWSKLSGPAQGTILNTSSVSTAVNNLVQGVYVFQLKITDSNGNSSIANVSITVNAAPIPPVAEAGDAQIITLPTNVVTLDAGASVAPAGNITQYEWSIASGPSAGTISNPASSKTSATGLTEGVYEFQLKITDNLGATAVDIVLITVKAAPAPPVAIAGNNITIQLPVNMVTLDGSASSSPDGTITDYMWTKISGPSQGVIIDPLNSSTAVSGLVAAIYVFELKVTDDNGNSSIATVTVTVNAAPQPPVANAGTNQTIVLPANNVNLDAGGSTAPSGNIVSYEWSKISGPASGNLSSTAIANPQATDLTEGIYTFQVKVTDNNGLSSTSTVIITVNAAPLPPVSNAGVAQTIVLPQNSVILDGSSSTAPSGTIVSYEWKKLIGGTAVLSDATLPATQVSGLGEGIYHFQLKVTDNNNQSAISTVIITVEAAPLPPVANAGTAQTIILPQNNITLDGSKSTSASGTIVSYAWTKISGPVDGLVAAAGDAVTTVNGLTAGVYTYELKVTNSYGLSSTATVTITVKAMPVPPVADAGSDIEIMLPLNNVKLDGSGSTSASGSISSYSWSKISGPTDGAIANASVAATMVNNLTEGIYEFELKVTDSSGLNSMDKVTVTVIAPLQLPVADGGLDQTISLPQHNITLDGGKSVAPSGIIITYLWTKISGPSGDSIVNPSGVTTIVNNLSEGVYVFELKVTDNNGNSATSLVTVTVNAAPLPPIANAGLDQTITLPVNSVSLDAGNSTAPSGVIKSYEWSKVSGPAGGNLSSVSIPNPQVTALAEGMYKYQVKVTDDNGQSSTATVTITVKAAPLPPVANAGTAQTIVLPQHSITLDGSKSTSPSDSIINYEWNKISGPADGTIVAMNNAITTVNGLSAGVYIFELKVTDSNGLSAIATITVTVENQPIPPVADAGNDIEIMLPVNSVMLDGSASTASSGSISSYKWNKVSGPSGGIIVNTSAASTVVNNLAEGIYEFELEIKDDSGQVSTDKVSVKVKAAPQPPVADAGGDIEIMLPLNSITLDGSKSSSASGSITGYVWTKLSGPAGEVIVDTSEAVTTVNNLLEGKYIFELEVTDNNGNSSVSTIAVTVKAAPLPPVANAGTNQTITLPQSSVSLDGSKSTASSGNIVSYLWTKISGPAGGAVANASAVTTVVNNLAEGVYIYGLKVVDNNGNSSVATVKVTVNAAPQPPVANAGTDQAITLPANSVTLDASGSIAPSGSIVSYEWSKVSGPSEGVLSSTSTPNPVATGLVEGVYTFQVKITDSNGLSATATVVVTVNAALLPPVSNAGVAQTIVLPQNTVTLDGSKSTAPSGTIVSYEWKKLSGGTALIADAGLSTTIVNNLTEGIYQFELKVTDNKGQTAIAIVTVTVKATPPPPVANAGNAQTITLPVNSITLDGSKSSAAAGSIVHYKWYVLSGPAGSVIVDTVKAKTTVINLVEGVYNFQLKVTDNVGSTATSIVVITVKAAPLPPIANAGLAQVITLPVNTITLNATLSTAPAGTIKNFVWTKQSGPSAGEITNPGSGMTTVTNLVAGTYQFQVKVIDNNNNSSLATVSITVNPAIVKPPVANAGEDQQLQLPSNVIQLDGSKSYAIEGSIKNYKWVVVSASSEILILNASTVTPSVLAVPEGVYTFRLYVTDTYSSVDSADVTFAVVAANTLPELPVVYIQSDSVVSLPQTTIIVDGSNSYSIDKTIVKYEWSIVSGPDGAVIENPANPITTISSLTDGEYEFGLKVTDNKGNVSMSIVKIKVNNPGGKPDLRQTIQVYPNPAQNVVYIKLTGESKGRTMIDVFDANGKRVMHKEVIKDNASFLQTIDVSGLKKGIYFIEVIIDYSYRTSYKLIKL